MTKKNEQERKEIRESIIKDLKNSDKITTNLFTILGLETKEVIHSRFLAYLLSPTGKYKCGGNDSKEINVTHDFGTEFLKKFIEQCKLNNIKEKDLNNAEVFIEYPTDYNRRIDILIKIGNFWIGIENKIYAGDQENQLNDYYYFLKNKPQKNFCLIYLTLEGRNASEYSTRNEPIRYTQISYSIIKTLLEEIPNKKILMEYKSILEILTRDYTIFEKLWLEQDWDWKFIDELRKSKDNKKINDILKNYIYPDIISSMLQKKDDTYYQENNAFYIWVKKTKEAEYDIYFEFDEKTNKVFYYPIKIESKGKWMYGNKNVPNNKWRPWASRQCWNNIDGFPVNEFDIKLDNVKKQIEEMKKFIENNS